MLHNAAMFIALTCLTYMFCCVLNQAVDVHNSLLLIMTGRTHAERRASRLTANTPNSSDADKYARSCACDASSASQLYVERGAAVMQRDGTYTHYTSVLVMSMTCERVDRVSIIKTVAIRSTYA
jgi:hypothetical protein